MRLSSLERRLFGNLKLDLAQAALIASGVINQRELESYLLRMAHLHRQISEQLSAEFADVAKAEAIFNCLWKGKTNRYKSRGNFKLTDVIDAQIGGKESVGNCLGLTILYNALTQSFGLGLKAVHLEDAFGLGPHVFSILYTEGGSIDIENIFPHGFDFKGHADNPGRQEWGNAELVADLYFSRANDLFEQGSLENAIENYDKALRLNPGYTKAYLNKAMALSQLGRAEEAKETLLEESMFGKRKRV